MRILGALLASVVALGFIKTKPASWKALFFPEAHGLPGS